MRFVILTLVVLGLCGGLAAYHFSDGQVHKRQLRALLGEFQAAVATSDRFKVSNTLNTLLTDDAKIRLNVHFFSIGNARPDMAQDFDKPQFITFIDNILYSLTHYSYTPSLSSFDEETGTVIFTSSEWGDGKDMLGGVAVEMRYGSDTHCEGKAMFEKERAVLSQLSCELQFRQMPKPGQAEKLINTQKIIDMLKK